MDPSGPRRPDRRTVLRFTAGAAVALPLAACSGSSGPSTVRIAYQQFGSGTQLSNWLNASAKTFTKDNPGLSIELVPIVAAENDYFTKNELLMSSPRTSADVVYEDSFIMLSDVGAGYLQPMDEEIATWEHWDDVAPASRDAFTAEDGHVYGTPQTTDTRALYYHRDVFEEAGLPTTWEPRNWDDILEAARAIKDSDSEAAPMFIFSGKAQGEKASMQGFEMLLYGTTSRLYDEKSKKWVLGGKGFVDALGLLKTMFDEELTLPVSQHLDPNIGESIYSTMLPAGKLGIILDGSWNTRNWAKGSPGEWPEWTEKIGFAKMPTKDGQDPGTLTLAGGWGMTIPQYCRDKKAAWAFIEAATSTQNSLDFAIADNHITVRKDVAAKKEYQEYAPSVEFFTDLLATAYYRPALPAYPEVSAAIQEAMEAVMTAGDSPEEAAAAYDAAVTDIVGPENVQEESR
ncbi:sugar ABC transporter substrate-binding protein [Brachybacterium endophyticum]|uniref:Sugar ABC transporter substrate-binding protein n=1 Tax=Brachybacterium endophyticum TaxID=2182385 RepID=A0A2U2RIT3_9MICO|nr:extracellular solute-binding protein [Brachybacterium endophyticum]PWH05751.1 sugar ABC transporter substrate-binding protein [Brachybacterium endophyticum]